MLEKLLVQAQEFTYFMTFVQAPGSIPPEGQNPAGKALGLEKVKAATEQ